MGLLLHIQILEYLQQNTAMGEVLDIKPVFEKQLDSMPKRKELKAELDFILDQKFAASTSKFDFLNWELLTGLYPLDKKKIELVITEKGINYLHSQTTPRFAAFNDIPEEDASTSKTGLYDPPETVLAYPKPEENIPVPTAKMPVVQAEPQVVIPLAEPEEKPVVEQPLPVVQAEPVSEKTFPSQPPTPATPKQAPAPLTPQPIAERTKKIANAPTPTEQDTEPVILTARTARVLNKKSEPPVSIPEPPPVQAPPVKPRTLTSVSDLPPGPVSLGSAPSVTKTAFKAREAKVFATDNNPFAALEVIPLAPTTGKEKKPIDTATLLRWAVIIVAFVLAILLYLIFKKRY